MKPAFMSHVGRVGKALELLTNAMSHRDDTANYIRKMGEYLRGRASCRERYKSMPSAVEAQSTQPAPNPLRAYFDAVTTGPGVWKWLHYFDIYQRHLAPFVGRRVDLVEIGIYSGGSLPMWRAYLGEQCKVYGIDLEPACKAYEGENTKIFIGDQADRAFWQHFNAKVPSYDIVIDDGGHLHDQQIVTLEETLGHLGPGGVYLCEDIHGISNRFTGYVLAMIDELNSGWPATEQRGVSTEPSAFQRANFSLHLYPFALVIERGPQPQLEFVAPKHGTEWQPFL